MCGPDDDYLQADMENRAYEEYQESMQRWKDDHHGKEPHTDYQWKRFGEKYC